MLIPKVWAVQLSPRGRIPNLVWNMKHSAGPAKSQPVLIVNGYLEGLIKKNTPFWPFWKNSEKPGSFQSRRPNLMLVIQEPSKQVVQSI